MRESGKKKKTREILRVQIIIIIARIHEMPRHLLKFFKWRAVRVKTRRTRVNHSVAAVTI